MCAKNTTDTTIYVTVIFRVDTTINKIIVLKNKVQMNKKKSEVIDSDEHLLAIWIGCYLLHLCIGNEKSNYYRLYRKTTFVYKSCQYSGIGTRLGEPKFRDFKKLYSLRCYV